MICSRFRLSLSSSEGTQPASSLWDPRSCLPSLHKPFPAQQASLDTRTCLSSIFIFVPHLEKAESRHGSTLREQEDVEHSSEVSGWILAISSLWHSENLEKVMELKGEGRMKLLV